MRPRSGPGGEKMDQTQLLLNCLADESSEGIWEEWVCVLSYQHRWYKSIKNTLVSPQWRSTSPAMVHWEQFSQRTAFVGKFGPNCWSICAAKNDVSQMPMAELAHCDRMMQTVQPQKQCWRLWVAMGSTLGVCHVVSRSSRADSFICAGRLVVYSPAHSLHKCLQPMWSNLFLLVSILFKQAGFGGGCIVLNSRS